MYESLKTTMLIKIKYVIDNILLNLKPNKEFWLLTTLKENYDINDKNIKLLEVRKIIYNCLGINKSINRYNKEYWIKRGWDENEIKSKMPIAIVKDKSPMRINFWLNKGLTEKEAIKKIKEQRPCNKEYWIKQGCSDESANMKVNETQKIKSVKLVSLWKDNEYRDNHLKNCNTSIQYYTSRGFTIEEANKKISERQSTFSLEKCVKKYGDKEGRNKWRERQIKWHNSYKKQNYSNISQELFWELYNKIKIKDVYFATNCNGVRVSDRNLEFKIKTKITSRALDFYIPSIKKCIEFDGDYWHGERRGNQQRDLLREQEILDSLPDIKIFHVKEKDYRKEKEKTIQLCLEFINE